MVLGCGERGLEYIKPCLRKVLFEEGTLSVSEQPKVRVKEGFYFSAAFLMLMSWLMWDHFRPWQSFYNELFAGLSLLLLSSALFFPLYRRRIDLTAPALLLFAIVLIPLLQYVFGQITFLGDSAVPALYLAGLALSYWTGCQIGKQQRKDVVDVVAGTLLLGAMVSLFLASCQWLDVYRGWWVTGYAAGGRPYANLAQPNHLATLFCLGLVAALYLREVGRFGGWVTGLIVLMLLAGMVITRSRMPYVFMVVIFAWVLWQKNRFSLKCSWLQLVIGAVVFMGLVWVRPYISDWVVVIEGGGAVEQGRTYDSGRLVIWQQILSAIGQAPMFGYGWGQVVHAQIAVATELPSYRVVEYSHSIILDIFVWNGVFVGGVLLVAMGWWLVSRILQCQDVATWFLLLVIGLVGVDSLLGFPFAYAYFLLPVGLCAGTIDSVCRGNRLVKLRVPGWVPVVVVVAGWASLSYLFMDYRTMEWDHRQMRLEGRGVSERRPNEEPRVRLLTQLAAYNRYARTLATENMSESELVWMGEVAHRYPYPPALFRYALALGLNGKHEEAELELRRLKNLHASIRYEEGVAGWEILSARYPQLRQVTLPQPD